MSRERLICETSRQGTTLLNPNPFSHRGLNQVKTLLGQVQFCTEPEKLSALIARAEVLLHEAQGDEAFLDRLQKAKDKLGELKSLAKVPEKEDV